MPLRVGFDLDGTVADMHSALRREAVKLFGEEVLRRAVQKPEVPDGSAMETPAVAAETAANALEDR